MELDLSFCLLVQYKEKVVEVPIEEMLKLLTWDEETDISEYLDIYNGAAEFLLESEEDKIGEEIEEVAGLSLEGEEDEIIQEAVENMVEVAVKLYLMLQDRLEPFLEKASAYLPDDSAGRNQPSPSEAAYGLLN